MKYKISVLFIVLLTVFSCSKNEFTSPPYDPEENLENTLPISDTIMRNMEGIYRLSDGNDKLGKEFVCKVSKRRVSFFSNLDGIFIILKYGFNPTDSSIQFAGFWRYSETTDQGKIGFSIPKGDGGIDLILSEIADNIKIQGMFMGVDFITRPITLQFNRHFTQYAQDNPFTIFAHHGVQTTSNPPYAENSLDGALNDEDYGVSGLEFDVRMTKDNVPICIHDGSINTRLTLKGPLSGDYDQYTFQLLSDYVRLIDGQKIPSVEQVLQVFVESTNLKYMWLDVKGNPGVFKALEPIIRNAYANAAALNRDVVIFCGLSSDENIAEYNTQPTFTDLPTLCELTYQDVIDTHSEFWGPRYSEGLLLGEVDQAHSQGIKVFCWTLNDRNLIRSYLQDGSFDGFISDYPAYVVYDFYTMF